MSKKKLSCILITTCIILSGCSGGRELSQIEIPEEKISEFQRGSIKSKPEEYEKLSYLIKDMEEAVPEKDQKNAPHKGEDYYPISFIYEDKTKDVFYFFFER